jgi:hypothetical protein
MCCSTETALVDNQLIILLIFKYFKFIATHSN